jgi:divalent metal cation (Fe/Co/Zn/Cd) transporter
MKGSLPMGNVFDFLSWFIVVFFFITYFMILFSVITDIFSDHDLGGGAKALWVILIIVTWWLGLLIYLIVRGKGMAKRRQALYEQAKKQQDDYIKSVAGTSHADELEKAAKLKKSGAITDKEYEALKKKILAS